MKQQDKCKGAERNKRVEIPLLTEGERKFWARADMPASKNVEVGHLNSL